MSQGWLPKDDSGPVDFNIAPGALLVACTFFPRCISGLRSQMGFSLVRLLTGLVAQGILHLYSSLRNLEVSKYFTGLGTLSIHGDAKGSLESLGKDLVNF